MPSACCAVSFGADRHPATPENDLHLKKVPPNLHGLFSRNTLPDGKPATDAEVEQVLLTGKGMMPSFAFQMSKEQMDAVVAYLHSGLGDQQKQ